MEDPQGRARAQPRLGARGAQAKPRGGAPPTGRLRSAPEKHFSAAAPALRPSGWTAAGRLEDAWTGTSLFSRAGEQCRERGRSPDGASAQRHRGAGFVSQAILYFNFRCIS